MIPDRPPVMSGCFRGNLDVDDYAAISFNRAGLRSVNGGFENGGLTSVSSWYTIGTISKITSGQQSGAYSAEMDNGDWLQQRIRVEHPPASVTFRTRYKTNGTTTRSFKGRFRQVSFSGSACGSGVFPPGLNYDSATVGAWTTVMNDPLTAASAWTAYTGPASPSLSSFAAVDVDLAVSVSGSGKLWLDDVRF